MKAMTCPGCGVRATFSRGDAVGWFKHHKKCPYALDVTRAPRPR